MAKALFTSELLGKLDRLSLTMREMARAQTGGNRKSRVRGTSVEFADYREYVLGDDFRRIDWNAYGRLERLYLKLFVEEREAVVSVFLDASRSMAFPGDPGQPARPMEKSEFARALCGAVSYLALKRQDRVQAFTVSGGRANPLPSFSGTGGFLRLLDFWDGAQFAGDSRLAQAVRGAAVRPGGVSILVSDLFTDDDWREAVRYLRFRKQDVAVMQVLCPEEARPEWEGRLRLIDSEGGPSQDVQMSGEVLRAYGSALARFHRDNESFCRQIGAAYLPVVSDAPLEEVFFSVLPKAQIAQ